MEDWEVRWKDYYRILQIDPAAEPEVVRGAYERLARKYHPDVNKDPRATERMTRINGAYEVLGNPEKRRRYDSAWRDRQGKGAGGAKAFVPPRPAVSPSHIQITDVEPRKKRRASFTVRNLGGPYDTMWVSNPDSWVKVVGRESLYASQDLPMRIEIEAEGYDWSRGYTEHIVVRLDEEEATVRVDLETRSQPATAPSVRDTVRAGTGKAPQARPRSGTVRKLLIALSVLLVLIAAWYAMGSLKGTSPVDSSPEAVVRSYLVAVYEKRDATEYLNLIDPQALGEMEAEHGLSRDGIRARLQGFLDDLQRDIAMGASISFEVVSTTRQNGRAVTLVRMKASHPMYGDDQWTDTIATVRRDGRWYLEELRW